MNTNRCFEILEISPDATYEEAKAAYRLMCQVWHPDKYTHSEQLHAKATSKIKEINAAWSHIEEYFKNGASREAEATESECRASEERERAQRTEQERKRREAAEQAELEKEKQKQSSMSRNASNTVKKTELSTVNQHLLWAISDYIKRPWWMVILPIVALTLFRACNDNHSSSPSNSNSYVPAQKPYVSELEKLAVPVK